MNNKNKTVTNSLITLFLPSAPMGVRLLASLCDLLLITLLAVFIIGKFWLVVYHSEALMQLRLLLEGSNLLDNNNMSEFMRQIMQNRAIIDMFINVDRVLFLITWAYFAINAMIFNGGSLGKQIFNLRVLKIINLQKTNFCDYILRSGMQTFVIFIQWPFVLMLNLCIMFCSKKHRGIHDIFCQTYVVHFGAIEQLKDQFPKETQQLKQAEGIEDKEE